MFLTFINNFLKGLLVIFITREISDSIALKNSIVAKVNSYQKDIISPDDFVISPLLEYEIYGIKQCGGDIPKYDFYFKNKVLLLTSAVAARFLLANAHLLENSQEILSMGKTAYKILYDEAALHKLNLPQKYNIKLACANDSNEENLYHYIAEHYPVGTSFFHLCAKDITGKISRLITEDNKYYYNKFTCYQANPLPISSHTKNLIVNKKINIFSFLSSRTANIFVNQMLDSNCDFSHATAVVFSKNIANELSCFNFQKIIYPTQRNIDEYINLISYIYVKKQQG